MAADNRKEIESMSVDELRNLVFMQREQLNNLQLEVSRLRAALFGKKSEKRSRVDEEQQLLFIAPNAYPEIKMAPAAPGIVFVGVSFEDGQQNRRSL